MPDPVVAQGAPAETQAPPATPVTPALTDTSTELAPERSSEWFDRLLGRGRATDQPASSDQPDAAQGAPAETQAPPKAAKREVDDTELDRLVQAETDRREARRTAASQTQAARAQRAALRDTDPYAHAALEKAEEAQLAQLGSTVTRVTKDFDSSIVDPLVLRLSEKERAEVVALAANAADGLAGRKAIVEASIDRIIKAAKADGAKEAEARLRKNPAFTKQVLAELRGDADEPDLASGSAASRGVDAAGSMNAWMRGALGRPTN